MWKAAFLFGFLLVACYATGGFEDVDTDNGEVLTAAAKASQELSNKFNSKYHHKLVKVVKAKKQIVAGTNYRLDIIVGMTVCKKADVEYDQIDSCDFQEGVSTYKKCTVLVYRDLKNNHKLVSSGCILASKKEI